jgi:hypothetical protein
VILFLFFSACRVIPGRVILGPAYQQNRVRDRLNASFDQPIDLHFQFTGKVDTLAPAVGKLI